MNRKGNLAVFNYHTKKGCNPEPEHSAVATHGDSNTRTDDVTCTNRSGKSGCYSLEGCNRAFLGVLLFKNFTDGVLHSVAKFSELKSAAANSKVETA